MARLSLCLAAALALACSGATPAPSASAASVLLVTIDTLRADRVGAYGDASARTPNIDGLARGGVVFEAAYCTAPITLPSHASLLTGLLPPAHGVRGNGSFALGKGARTLGEVLRSRGLRSAAFVGAFPLARRFGLDRGFDHYDDAFERAPGLHFEFPERPADRVVAAARAWLAANPGPAFVWVHLYDPHAPYAPPAEFRGADPYRGEIAFVDSALGPLLLDWDARPGPAVVALAADHGEAFGEHEEESHSLFVYDTTLRVPLVLRGAGVPAGRRIATPVSLVDLPASLADLAGASGSLPGASLRPLWAHEGARGAAVYAETLAPRLDFGWSDLRAWRDGKFKYVRAPRPELFDLEADPGETRNLVASEPERARAMAADLETALKEMGERESRAAADPEAAERLRALGYVQGPGGRGSGADPKDRVGVARSLARASGPFSGPEEVVRTYREIVALDPENPLANFRLADALLRAGRAREAVPHFTRVIEGGPTSADPFVGLATAYAELGRIGDAERVLRRALDLELGSGQVHFNLGEIARSRGDEKSARAAYEAALSDESTRARARERLDSLR